MRYAIFSDVHSNLEAFKVVLSYYRQEDIDKYIFLGDIVGYGGDPGDCIDILKSLKPLCIAGNHDWAAIDKFSVHHFNVYAKEAILWTKKQLREDDRSYLKNFYLKYIEDDFISVHGSLKSPQDFNYILDTDDAALNFQLFKNKLLFVGHSHRAGAYCLDKDSVFYLDKEEFELNSDKRYIVNVGSVGQPRDADPRASFCIYDSNEQKIQLLRIGYDIAKAAASIIGKGLPPMLATRLYDGC